jgi:hypothetical protein
MNLSFLQFMVKMKGKEIILKDKSICKASAYWGLRSGRTKWNELTVHDKPGWEDGTMYSSIKYSVWLSEKL